MFLGSHPPLRSQVQRVLPARRSYTRTCARTFPSFSLGGKSTVNNTANGSVTTGQIISVSTIALRWVAACSLSS